ncbi:MAG: hypothetical protein ACREIV_11780 [Planctomycetaceae bacterium]
MAESRSGAAAADSLHLAIEDVQPGDVVRRLVADGESVAVAEFTVVDVQQAVGAWQLLLMKNDIQKVDGEPSVVNGERIDGVPPRLTTMQTADGRLAVYVESSEAQLAQAIAQLRTQEEFQDLFRELRVGTPVDPDEIQIAALDGFAEQERRLQPDDSDAERLSEALVRNRRKSAPLRQAQQQPPPPAEPNSDSKAARRLATQEDNPAESPRRPEPQPPSIAERESPPAPSAPAAEALTAPQPPPAPPVSSFQFLVNIPQDSLLSFYSYRSPGHELEPDDPLHKSQAKDSTADKQIAQQQQNLPEQPRLLARRKEASEAPVRVIFLFNTRPAGE